MDSKSSGSSKYDLVSSLTKDGLSKAFLKVTPSLRLLERSPTEPMSDVRLLLITTLSEFSESLRLNGGRLWPKLDSSMLCGFSIVDPKITVRLSESHSSGQKYNKYCHKTDVNDLRSCLVEVKLFRHLRVTIGLVGWCLTQVLVSTITTGWLNWANNRVQAINIVLSDEFRHHLQKKYSPIRYRN